jgi:dipeptidyl aminopeptidase/acylaminoacyl peptidase
MYEIGPACPDGDFAWSPDGREIAYVSASDNGIIEIASDLESVQRITKKMEAMKQGDIREIAWSPDGNSILFSCRGHLDEHNQLRLLNLNTSSTTSLIQFDECAVSKPVWLDDSKHFVFLVHDKGVSQVKMSETPSNKILSITNNESVNEIAGYSAKTGEIFVLENSLDDIPRLVSLQTRRIENPQTIYPEMTRKAFAGQKPELVSFVAPDGIMLQGFLWAPSKATRLEATAIIYAHGGPHLSESPKWNAGTQLLVLNGIYVLTVNYRGSTNQGASFEEWSDVQAHADDIFAARQYLKSALGIANDRVFLWGSSYGTSVAITALARSPNDFGGIVLLSTNCSPFSC